MILIKYQNELFHLIRNSGIDIHNFSKTETQIGTSTGFLIELKNTPLKFSIRNRNDFNKFDYSYVTFTPNYYMTNFILASDFSIVTQAFTKWLNEHAKEYLKEKNETNLWDQFNFENKALELTYLNFTNKDFFDEKEKQHVRLALKKIRTTVETSFSLMQEDFQNLDDRLNYLSEAVDRLNKFDWSSLLLSTIISISIALSFDTEKGKQLFLIFKRIFDVIPKLDHP